MRLPILAALILVVGCAGGEAPEGPSGSSEPQAPAGGPTGSVDVTYVGNEGFLIEGGGRKVLIDSLYREGVPGYVSIPVERRDLLEAAKPPFDAIDLILATHEHPDHFDPQSVGTHLRNNPDGLFVSTQQAVSRLASEFEEYAEIADRVIGITPTEGVKAPVDVEGIDLVVINLHHGRDRPFENIGFLIGVGGMTLLHVGDTEATASDYAIYDLPSEDIDLAFLPFYQLVFDEWRTTVPLAIGADRFVVMHVPPPGIDADYIRNLGGREGMLEGILATFPGTVLIDREMETRTLEDMS